METAIDEPYGFLAPSDDRRVTMWLPRVDDEFVVRGLKVIEGTHGRFVAMPARKKKDGTFQDIAHPINSEARDYLEKVVLEAYEQEIASPTGAGASAD